MASWIRVLLIIMHIIWFVVAVAWFSVYMMEDTCHDIPLKYSLSRSDIPPLVRRLSNGTYEQCSLKWRNTKYSTITYVYYCFLGLVVVNMLLNLVVPQDANKKFLRHSLMLHEFAMFMLTLMLLSIFSQYITGESFWTTESGCYISCLPVALELTHDLDTSSKRQLRWAVRSALKDREEQYLMLISFLLSSFCFKSICLIEKFRVKRNIDIDIV